MGVSVILKSQGKFLLQLRDDKKEIENPNKWSLFGGAIEKDETPKAAAVREMREELELKIKEEDLKLIFTIKFKTANSSLFLLTKEVNPSELKLHEGQAMKLFFRRQIIFMKKVALPTRLFFLLYNI